MNRRAFLSTLLAAGAGAAIDPERLLWTPRPMISVPAGPWTVKRRIAYIAQRKLMARIRITGEAMRAGVAGGAFAEATRVEIERCLELEEREYQRLFLHGNVFEVLPAIPGHRYVRARVEHLGPLFIPEDRHASERRALSAQG
jgi:hypothetical protein